jgi:uncharacterized protein
MSFSLSPLLIAELLLLGCFTGFLSGLLGIGGSLVMVPFLMWMFQSQGIPRELATHAAIATSLGTLLFSSLSSMRAHHKRGAVRWTIVWQLVPGILIGSYLGSWLGMMASGILLILVFSFFLIFSAWQMWANKKPKPTRELPHHPGMIGMGGVIGTVSGLVGAGGGFISVPFMTWCNVTAHNAVATSAALGFPIALAGTIGNVINGWGSKAMPPGSLGFVYVPALLIIALASSTLAPLGARTAHSMNTAQLKRVFALLLLCLAGNMIYKTLAT